MNYLKSTLHPKIDHKCDYEENRFKVCAPCRRKIIFGNKKSNYFRISERYEKLIKMHINANFNSFDIKFPRSICCTCRLTLCDYEKNDFKRPLPTMPNYEDISLPKEIIDLAVPHVIVTYA